VLNKLKAIAGDVGEENLGISPEDRSLLTRNVNVVIHSAATLDFEATLKETIQINILGTMKVLQLASEMTNIQVCCFLWICPRITLALRGSSLHTGIGYSPFALGNGPLFYL